MRRNKRFQDFKPESLERAKKRLAIMGVIALICGLLFFIAPDKAINLVNVFLSVLLIGYGILEIFYFLQADVNEKLGGNHIAYGLTAIAIGIFFLLRPDVVEIAIGLVAGVLFIYHSGYIFQLSILQQRAHHERWWLALIFGLFSIALGTYSIVSPQGTNEVFVRILGAGLIVMAICDGFLLVTSDATDFMYAKDASPMQGFTRKPVDTRETNQTHEANETRDTYSTQNTHRTHDTYGAPANTATRPTADKHTLDNPYDTDQTGAASTTHTPHSTEEKEIVDLTQSKDQDDTWE